MSRIFFPRCPEQTSGRIAGADRRTDAPPFRLQATPGAVLACAIWLTPFTSLHAQTPKREGAPRDPVEHRITELKEKLKLTEDQLAKTREIFKENAPKLREIRDDKSLPEDQKREKFRELMKANLEKVASLLTPEQKKDFLALRSAGPEAGTRPDGPPFLRLEALKERLKLTDAQSQKLGPLLKEAAEKMRAFRDETDPAQRRQKAQEALSGIRDAIAAELTPEQKQQFREWMEQHRPPGTPPPPK
jgi:Spy/CpxP family protein refolding chaperone